jgi:S-adenosylmethionine:tRNA ribosyltransferase-isomerase
MSEFDYELPPDLIAQEPLENRSASRLMVVDRASGDIAHSQFAWLPSLLNDGDLLVMNDSRVVPARLIGHRQTGGEVEFLLLREVSRNRWLCLMRPARKLGIGERIEFEPILRGSGPTAYAMVIEKSDDGQGIVELGHDLAGHLDAYGRVPLPPYIHHQLADDGRYQTVYARAPGSAAAPTAGLHFSQPLFDALAEKSVQTTSVTLHVGLDTFRPVTAEYAEDHVIHSEWCSVPDQAVRAIWAARARGARVVAVGTTAARTLETFGRRENATKTGAFSGMTDIFITPGYEWKVVDAMITNFHLPKSTLLLMMSSFAGKSLLFEAYRQAIQQRYRFFSFGDAMLIT